MTSYLDKTEYKNKPLVKKIDESGMTVYTVPNSLGEFFSEMFKNVDANLESLNISQYSIRSASLEEVFINIGERERLGELPIESTANRLSRTSSYSSMREQRTQLGEKTSGRSFKAFFSLNMVTSIPKIIIVVIVALITISLGCYASVFTAKMSSPSINSGSIVNVYGNSAGQTPVVNNQTIVGG